MTDKSTTGAPAAAQPSGPAGDQAVSAPVADALARANERLAFYESFDAVIQENVRRSGELLRQMAEEREQSQRRLEAMQAEVDGRLTEQREMLAEIAASLAGLQQNVGDITARVNASLSRLSAPVGAPPESGIEPGGAESPVAIEAPEESDDAGPTVVPADRLVTEQPVAFFQPATGVAIPASSLEIGAGADAGQLHAADAPPSAPAAATGAALTTQPPAGPRRIDLVIHGVPKAATALAIQRHLQDLPAVQAVEVREYVSGVLRFHVVAQDLRPADLASWEGGDGLEALTSSDSVLELRLPTAEGL